jgi:hypothetical protein
MQGRIALARKEGALNPELENVSVSETDELIQFNKLTANQYGNDPSEEHIP